MYNVQLCYEGGAELTALGCIFVSLLRNSCFFM